MIYIYMYIYIYILNFTHYISLNPIKPTWKPYIYIYNIYIYIPPLARHDRCPRHRVGGEAIAGAVGQSVHLDPSAAQEGGALRGQGSLRVKKMGFT